MEATPGSLAAHRIAVVQTLADAKQELTSIVSELQMLRVRQALASKAALYSEGTGNSRNDTEAEMERLVQEDAERERLRAEKRDKSTDFKKLWDDRDPSKDNHDTGGLRKRHGNSETGKATAGWDLDASDMVFDDDEDDLDPETMNQLAQEQSALSAQLHEEMQQAKQAEKQMNEFSELAELFSQKLSEQHNDIISLENDVGTSTEMMHRAGDELISAKEHNKSFRKYVIIFFSVATLTLLIMDKMDD